MSLLAVVWAVQVGAELFALFWLVRRRMYRYYPALVAYIAASFVDDGVGLLYDTHSAGYFSFWFYSEIVMLGLKCVLVWELVRKMLQRYRGIGSFATTLVVSVVGVSVVLCLFTMAPELHAAPWAFRRYQLILMSGRWITTVLAGVVGLLAAFFLLYRTSRRPNLILHQWVTFVNLAGNAGLWFYAELAPGRLAPALWRLALATVCFLAWAQLSPRGESEAVLPPGVSLETLGELLGRARSGRLTR